MISSKWQNQKPDCEQDETENNNKKLDPIALYCIGFIYELLHITLRRFLCYNFVAVSFWCLSAAVVVGC